MAMGKVSMALRRATTPLPFPFHSVAATAYKPLHRNNFGKATTHLKEADTSMGKATMAVELLFLTFFPRSTCYDTELNYCAISCPFHRMQEKGNAACGMFIRCKSIYMNTVFGD